MRTTLLLSSVACAALGIGLLASLVRVGRTRRVAQTKERRADAVEPTRVEELDAGPKCASRKSELHPQVRNEAEAPVDELEELRRSLYAAQDEEGWVRVLHDLVRCPRREVLSWFPEFLRSSADPAYKMRAMMALGERPEAEAFSMLCTELQCEDPFLRACAAVAIVARSEWDPASLSLADTIREDPSYRPWLQGLPLHLQKGEVARPVVPDLGASPAEEN